MPKLNAQSSGQPSATLLDFNKIVRGSYPGKDAAQLRINSDGTLNPDQDCGDGLLDIILTEIQETFSENSPRTKQLKSAQIALGRLLQDVAAVEAAFNRAIAGI